MFNLIKYLTLKRNMKSILTLIILLFAVIANAQTKNNTIIGKANTVNIYSGNVSIGQVNITQTLRPKIILESVTQKKDTADTYKTVFLLKNAGDLPFFNVNIILSFNKLW